MANRSVQSVQISIMPKTLVLILGFWFAIRFLVQVQQAIVLFLLSCILASALYPLIIWLKKWQVPRKLSILLVYLALFLIASGLVILVGNVLLEEGSQFVLDLPSYLDMAIRRLEHLPLLRGDQGLWSTLSAHIGTISTRLIQIVLSSLDYLWTFVGGILSIVTILVFTFFLLSDTHYFEKAFLNLFYPSQQERLQRLLHTTATHVGSYARGQLLVMSGTGLLTWLGLSLMGVPYAFILGLLAFLLDIIPILGPVLAGFIGVTIALAQSPMLALWAGLVYFVVQQVENYLLYPLIMGKATGLHPFWILFSILLGGIALGVTGVILAVPISIVVAHLLETFYLPWIQEERASRA